MGVQVPPLLFFHFIMITTEQFKEICETQVDWNKVFGTFRDVSEDPGLKSNSDNFFRSKAFELAEEVENISLQYITSLKLGKPKILSINEMKKVLSKAKNYKRSTVHPDWDLYI